MATFDDTGLIPIQQSTVEQEEQTTPHFDTTGLPQDTPQPNPNVELANKYKTGQFTPEQKAAAEELHNRGVVDLKAQSPEQVALRQQSVDEVIKDIWPTTAFAISIGKGVENVGRGLGLLPEPSQQSQEGMAKLEEEYPIATTAGEITGEATPFMLPGGAIGKIASMPLRATASGILGGAEGGILSNAHGQDPETGAGLGAAIGVSAEVLFPIVGRLGRSLFQRITGKAPKGYLLDAAGKPTQEFNKVLNSAGISFDDLTEDAVDMLKGQQNVNAQQAAIAARAKSAGVPLSKGELTQDYAQQSVENRLLESSLDKNAEGFRNFKLKQSDAVRKHLAENIGTEMSQEDTGILIQEALMGRKNLLRTTKNRLYAESAENAKSVGGINVFTDNIKDAVPDDSLLEDLAVTAEGPVNAAEQILIKYGIKEPTQEMIEKGFQPTPLTVENFDRLRKSLNRISRSDNTGAVNVITGPVIDALDNEVDELITTLSEKGIGSNVIEPLKEGRKLTRTLHTEFSPQSVIGKLVNAQKDGYTPVMEASKVYNRIVGRSAPVEQTRRVVSSLLKAPKGEEALAALQTTTLMDLIDAGFTTNTRKIQNINVFNPVAFKNKIKAIGEPKLKEIFKNNFSIYRKIKNIDAIAKDLIPPSGAVPKGSATVVQDMATKLGLMSITGKIPGGAAIADLLMQPIDSAVTRRAVKGAQVATPERLMIEHGLAETFPGIAAALGITLVSDKEEK